MFVVTLEMRQNKENPEDWPMHYLPDPDVLQYMRENYGDKQIRVERTLADDCSMLIVKSYWVSEEAYNAMNQDPYLRENLFRPRWLYNQEHGIQVTKSSETLPD